MTAERKALNTGITTGQDGSYHLRVDPQYFRPTEVDELCGDAPKAAEQVKWSPQTTFRDLISLMLEHYVGRLGLSLER